MVNRLFITLLLFLVTSPSLLSTVPSVEPLVETRDGHQGFANAGGFNLDDLVITDEMVNQMQHEQPSLYKKLCIACAAAKQVIKQHVAEHKTAYTAAAVAAVAGAVYWHFIHSCPS